MEYRDRKAGAAHVRPGVGHATDGTGNRVCGTRRFPPTYLADVNQLLALGWSRPVDHAKATLFRDFLESELARMEVRAVLPLRAQYVSASKASAAQLAVLEILDRHLSR